ncbi:MAG: YIP1 family protein [Candidatus Micrarchaeales archaeon]
MGYMNDLRFAYSILFRPASAAKKNFTARQFLGLYYKLTVIPFIIYLVIGALLIQFGASSISTSLAGLASIFPIATALAYPLLILSGVLIFWIAIPIGFAIDAFIYQIVGKLFLNVWKGNYDKTFVAAGFAVMPAMLFYWLLSIPILNVLYIIVVGIWEIVLLVIALSVQQKVSRLQAFASVLSGLVLAILVVLLIVVGIIGAAHSFGGVPSFWGM